MAGAFFMPLRSALRLALRWPPLLVWLIAFGMGSAISAAVAQYFFEMDPIEQVWFGILATIGPIVVSGILIFFLARTLLTDAAGYGRPLYLRFVGLYLFAAVALELIDAVTSMALLSQVESRTPLLYASPVVGAVANFAVFPMFVRSFAAAAGVEEPRLSAVWSFVFVGGRYAYFWYVACTIGLNFLSVLVFAYLPAGPGDGLARGLIQSAIAATGQVVRSMLDIVTVRMVARGWRDDVEVFA